MELTTLTRRVAEATRVDPAAIEPAEVPVERGGTARGPDLDPVPARAEPAGLHPRDLAEARANAAAWPDGPGPCETVRDAATLQRWIGEVRETGAVAFHAALTRSDPMLAEIAGLALAVAPGRACYVPLGHRAAGPQDLLGGGLAEGQI